MRVLGVGTALGETSLSNAALADVLPPDLVARKTGIVARLRTRHSTAQLAGSALRQALEDARLAPTDLAGVLLSTNSGDQWVPPTSATVARDLGLTCPVMDVNAACAGGLYALRLAAAFAGPVAVVASETVSRFCSGEPGDWCAAIFGDGAGALIVEAPPTFRGAVWGTAPEGWGWMTVLPPDHIGQMDGRKLFEAAVPLCADALRAACRQAGVEPQDLVLIVPHQANLRLLEAVAERLGVSVERMEVTVQTTGNMSSASLPTALASALRARGRGGLTGLVAFGAGLTYGALVCDIVYSGTGAP